MADLEDRELIRRMERWGYEFLERPHDNSPGYRGLVIAIRRNPTHQHYDPESVHLYLSEGHSTPAPVSLQLDPHIQPDSSFCPGTVTLSDRYDKRVPFFVFGGQIHIVQVADETLYLLQSTAPILELNPQFGVDIPSQLAAETQALWAKLRVAWRDDDSGFLRTLALSPALELYAATIASLLTNMENSALLRHAALQLHRRLLVEKRWLAEIGAWHDYGATLERLLAPTES